MIDALAVDTNAAIDFLRPERADPSPIHSARRVVLPLPALGELFAGAHYSDLFEENLAKIEELLNVWTILAPSVESARIYGQLRGSETKRDRTTRGHINDLWIAALCIQHNLPLLTNDRGFDTIPGLTVLHW